jgi:hypothetical protein
MKGYLLTIDPGSATPAHWGQISHHVIEMKSSTISLYDCEIMFFLSPHLKIHQITPPLD